MNHIQAPNHFGKQHLQTDEASWVNIVDLIFDIVRHQERLAIKRKALGRHKRSLALRNQTPRGRR
jgi:hypothetical protein